MRRIEWVIISNIIRPAVNQNSRSTLKLSGYFPSLTQKNNHYKNQRNPIPD